MALTYAHAHTHNCQPPCARLILHRADSHAPLDAGRLVTVALSHVVKPRRDEAATLKARTGKVTFTVTATTPRRIFLALALALALALTMACFFILLRAVHCTTANLDFFVRLQVKNK